MIQKPKLACVQSEVYCWQRCKEQSQGKLCDSVPSQEEGVENSHLWLEMLLPCLPAEEGFELEVLANVSLVKPLEIMARQLKRKINILS